MNEWSRRAVAATATVVLAFILAFVIGCNRAASVADESVPEGTPVTIFRMPGCTCCEKHAAYLESKGFKVVAIYELGREELDKMLPVDPELTSCHITVMGNFSIEGHVPAAAFAKLLREKPRIDGIVLPGMPPGSPGMDGKQDQPWRILAIKGGKVSEFMTIK